ncbi:hypothetical protein LO763_01530 [Glycomyces sp. A-F 0318]|uniref:hypothetical protein n=1 Tax=Glycomyces amatae TaxID=2881355 RepID=UPI001E4BFA42|nr:hypothetical protein [Glycomyces amatae]MCD0442306.1 hypothetical protein [Glycomyces amatae]
MGRVFDAAFVRQVGANIDANVVPVLESTDAILPELSAVDRGLHASVALPMAASYTTAVSAATESMAAAAESFRRMREALDGCAQDMEDADEACARSFGGE